MPLEHADPPRRDNPPPQILQANLEYLGGDIRVLAMDFPAQAATLIALGDLVADVGRRLAAPAGREPN